MAEQLTDINEIIYDLTELKTNNSHQLHSKISTLIQLFKKQINIYQQAISSMQTNIQSCHHFIKDAFDHIFITENPLEKIRKDDSIGASFEQIKKQIIQLKTEVTSKPQSVRVEIPIFVEKIVEVIIQKERQVPVIIERIIEQKVEVEVQKPIYIQKIIEVEVQKPIFVEKPIYIEKIIEINNEYCKKCLSALKNK